MRSSGGWPRVVALTLAGLSLTSGSQAQLLVLTSPGDPPALAHAEVAFATGEGQPVTWLSLRVRRGPVAVVAALPETASAEAALDAWLIALERSASPNVLLPAGATDCGKSSSFVHVSWPRSAGVGAEELTLTDAEDVAAALQERGLVAPSLPPSAPRYLVWSWPASDSEETTRTLRLHGVAAPLSFVPSSSWPVLVTTLVAGPSSLPGEAGTEQLRVTFVAGKPSSDYLGRLEDWIRQDKAPLLETRAGTAVFGWSLLAGAVSLPPLVRSYALAAAAERGDVDADACTEQLQALKRGDAPSATACGDATDASLALAATGVARPVLQRYALSGSAPILPESFHDGGDPAAALVRAALMDDSACPEVRPQPPIVLPPSTGGGTTQPRPGGTTTVVVEETVVVDDTYRGDSCGGSTRRDPYYDNNRTTFYCSGDTSSSSGDDSCSGDTSSSSGDDSCSGETSSSSGDDSCSGDTSSSSGDDSCSGDTSSSSGDDSCSGGSDSSYDGDTCTGRAAPGAEPKAAQAGLTSTRAARPQRLRVSLWSLAFAAVLLPIRRRKRDGVR